MQQIDMFNTDQISYLYTEINTIRNSTDRQRRAIFSMLTEIQDQVLDLREQLNKAKNEPNL